MSEENNRTAAALMLIAGGIIGAGLALLFAPQSGRATRKDIARYAKRTKRGAEDIIENFSDCVCRMAEYAGDTAEEILYRGKDLAEGTRKDLLNAFAKGQEKLEKERARLAKMVCPEEPK